MRATISDKLKARYNKAKAAGGKEFKRFKMKAKSNAEKVKEAANKLKESLGGAEMGMAVAATFVTAAALF